MTNIEIYVENPNTGRWEIIDLFEDESVNINFKLKDLNDISKVFSTYSQDFTVPASGNNNRVFNYFFQTDLVRVRNRGLNAKIFVNDDLFRTGQIVIREGRVENFKLLNYRVEFRTVIAQLKEKVGDDIIGNVIGDILNQNHSIKWDNQTVYDRMIWSSGDEDMLVPLVSNRRVWTYGDGGPNDIKQALKGVDKYELRPAIKLRIILDLLLQHYDLNVDFPLKYDEVFDKLYVWLNGKSEEEEQPPVTYEFKYTQPWTLTPGGIPTNAKTFFNITTNNGGMRIIDTGSNYSLARSYSVVHSLGPIRNISDSLPYKGRIITTVTQRETGEVMTYENLDVESIALVYYRLRQGTAGQIRTYDISFTFDNPVDIISGIHTTVSVLYHLGTGFPSNRMKSDNNSLPSVHNDFNIKYALGEWKVIDLFSSIFKMFNIRVIEDFNNNSMSWLSPDEFYSNNQVIDINKYTDIIKYNIQPSPNYKDIVFKHASENYFRNVEYKKLVNKDYGSEIYKSTDTALTESYQVETKVSIMNWFLLNGTSLKTSYGFSKPDSPQEPGTPTIFYNQGPEIIRTDNDAMNVDIRFKLPNSSNPNFTNQLARYIKFGNQSSGNIETYKNSITFDIDIEPSGNTPMIKSLYNNYYRVDIERLYQPNSNYYTFEGYLSLNKVLDFNMRNQLIIEDRLYSIEEASIDITTGKFKMKLLNFINNIADAGNEYPIPIPPMTFSSTGGVLKMDGVVNTGAASKDEISHYEIQYRRQGTNTWIHGLNLTYVPYSSQTWGINPVTPAGLYDARCRTVAPNPNPNTSAWVYAYNINVTGGIVFIPVDGVIDGGIGSIKRPPCLQYPPVLSPLLPVNKKIFFPVEDLVLIDRGMQVYEDIDLTIPYRPSEIRAKQVIGADYVTSFDLSIDLDGKISSVNPCGIQASKIKISNIPFGDVGSINMEAWKSSPKSTLYVDKAFKVNTRFFNTADLESPAEIIGSFENKYMLVAFDDGEGESTDVRYLKINDGKVSEVPLPIRK